jgi:hypothetical protein
MRGLALLSRRYTMKKVMTIIIDESIAKDIFEDYYEFADFISMETEAEYNMRNDGWSTWDGEEAGYDDTCDCDGVCSCEDDAHHWVDKRKVEI